MKAIIIGPTLLTRNCLESLIADGRCEIQAVYTLTEEAAVGKSRHAIMDDVTSKAGIPLHKVDNINDPDVVRQITEYGPDVIFELGWSQIISPEILKIPEKGCIGVHASLLPKNRGAASLNWAIINGETITGVSLFYLAEKPDDGDIIAQKEFSIDDRDDISTLHAKSDLASVELLIENMGDIINSTVKKKRQDPALVTYTRRRKPEDGLINWKNDLRNVHNWIRAQTHPFPGAFTYRNGMKLYVWKARPYTSRSFGRPGEIFRIKNGEGVLVNTYNGLMLIERAQAENGVEMWCDDLARKYEMKEGEILGHD